MAHRPIPAPFRSWALAALIAALMAGGARAGTETATLTVTARVQSGCSVSGGVLDFGTYTAGQPDDVTATGRITLTNCNGTVLIELDGGSSGNVQDRSMRSGNNRLRYQLYVDNGYSRVWGTGQQGLQYMALSNSATVLVYGRIPGGQNVPAGNYSDTVNVTITF